MTYNNKLYLNFNDFENHIQTTWEKLQTDQDFCDVTLICNDNQIRSHKFILSSYSPIFNNMLKNSSQNPMIYLRGVQYADLENILNFIYQGEANVSREYVNSFLMVANDLKIKGLFLEEDNVKLSPNKSLKEEKYNAKFSQENFLDTKNNSITQNIDQFSLNCTDEKLLQLSPLQNSDDTGIKNYVFIQNAVNQSSDDSGNEHGNEDKYNVKFFSDNSLDTKSNINTQNIKKFSENCHNEEMQQILPLQNNDDIKCTVVNNVLPTSAVDTNNEIAENVLESQGKYHMESSPGSISKSMIEGNDKNVDKIINKTETLQSDVLNDLTDTLENKNVDNIKGIDPISNEKNEPDSNNFSCDHCDFTSSGKLDWHKKIHHKVNHPCVHCDYKTLCDVKLKKHMKTTHFCDQCDFTAMKWNILYRHKDRIHKVKNTDKINCNKCSYKAINNTRLNDHIEALHGNSQHVCDDCGYKTTTNRNLSRHKNENHKGVIYFCDQCDYKNKNKHRLKKHIGTEHKGVRFPCNQCDFKAKQESNLRRHINSHSSSNPSVITKLKKGIQRH